MTHSLSLSISVLLAISLECIAGVPAAWAAPPPPEKMVQTAPTEPTLAEAARAESIPARRSISNATLAKYKTISVAVEENGKTNTYIGVPVRTILAEEIPAIDSMPEWKKLARRALVLKFTAEDGFPALIAATEIATNKSGDRFLLATECDGKAIEGGIRLICPKDEHHVRWARQITSLKFISLEKQ
jgi:hypothetical protein